MVMKVLRATKRLAFILCLLLGIDTYGQNILQIEITNAISQGKSFKEVELFNSSVSSGYEHLVSGASIFNANTSSISSILKVPLPNIVLTLQVSSGKTVRLVLTRRDIVSSSYKTGIIDKAGRNTIVMPKGIYYQGVVEGHEKSFSAISIGANGEIMGLFGTENGNYVIGKLTDGSERYILYRDADLLHKPNAACRVDDKMYSQISDNTGAKSTAAYGCNKVSLYWECDYELYQNKGSVSATETYMLGLFNQMQALYRNEGIAIELKSLYVWTVADGYRDNNAYNALIDFQNKWNAVSDTFDGDIAHLITMDTIANGGIAYVDILCKKNQAYAYSPINATVVQPIPTYSWDVLVLTHETGHNLGSNHTHWCGWMTASGNCGAIDNCSQPLEPSLTCASCNSVLYDDALPTNAWSGTLMSYCSFVARGVNFVNGFGLLPGNKIRSAIASATCLKPIISAYLTTMPICKFDGAITLQYYNNSIGTTNFGAAPFAYQWSNGAKTQNLYNLRNSGQYTVTIRDSNNCFATYTTKLEHDTSQGCFPADVGTLSSNAVSFVLFPNPAHETVTAKLVAHTAGQADIVITDLMGRVIQSVGFTCKLGENYILISVSGWAKGVYFISLRSNTGNYVNTKLTVD
ncbi:hypothetical protein CAP35_14975 [Chitinophagaceae bacterium IBVUCB1]|nr:hypothetical protein CAP35_14975 [Chitinophagaceae bacterium IBVUCB1]